MSYFELCSENSQELPKVLIITVLAEKREADQIQMLQNTLRREKPILRPKAQLYRDNANDLGLNFCVWSIMVPGSKPSQNILLVSSQNYIDVLLLKSCSEPSKYALPCVPHTTGETNLLPTAAVSMNYA